MFDVMLRHTVYRFGIKFHKTKNVIFVQRIGSIVMIYLFNKVISCLCQLRLREQNVIGERTVGLLTGPMF